MSERFVGFVRLLAVLAFVGGMGLGPSALAHCDRADQLAEEAVIQVVAKSVREAKDNCVAKCDSEVETAIGERHRLSVRCFRRYYGTFEVDLKDNRGNCSVHAIRQVD